MPKNVMKLSIFFIEMASHFFVHSYFVSSKMFSVYNQTSPVNSDTKFSFQQVFPQGTLQTILELNKCKVTSGKIPSKNLRIVPQKIWLSLTDIIFSRILNSVFPDEATAGVTPLREESYPDKIIYWKRSILPSL